MINMNNIFKQATFVPNTFPKFRFYNAQSIFKDMMKNQYFGFLHRFTKCQEGSAYMCAVTCYL